MLTYVLVASVIIPLGLFINRWIQLKKNEPQYRLLRDLDSTISAKREELEAATKKIQNLTLESRSLEESAARLKQEIEILTNDHDLLLSGQYKPRYDFADSKKYADRLDAIRLKQRELIKAKHAIVCRTEWTIQGSKAEGKKMIGRIIKLGLAAFNVQCDNEILSVRFDNIDRAETKLKKIFENVNELLEPNHCRIQDDFFSLKLEELHLAYEYQEQLQKEKEEQRLLREQMKEEERARREAQRAQEEAETEEKRYEQALEQARKELEEKSESERDFYAGKISELEAQLREAHEKRERAKSMAEQTRKGYVYIISNIGSFGEDIYKIGLTRRLDPTDRIKELGDASVPFTFDIHALVFSDDAPALESLLHQKFNQRRVNLVNERKEFFRVKIEEIAQVCKECHGQDFHLTLLAEAKEFRQTKALLNANTGNNGNGG